MEVVLETKVNAVTPLDFVFREWDDSRLYITIRGFRNPLKKSSDFCFSKEDAVKMAHQILDLYESKESKEWGELFPR